MGVISCSVLSVVVFVMLVGTADAWTGNVCSRWDPYYVRVEYCRYRFWGWCCSWGSYWECRYSQVLFCCQGWRHNGDQNCNIPVCEPPCQNGGTCSSPGQCTCPTTHQGFRCDAATCSYIRPCFPGVCSGNTNCDCTSGFQSPQTTDQDMCLRIEDNINNQLRTTEMQVRMSYWPRDKNMESYMIMADSTMLAQDKMDVFWSNRRIFNRIETQCGSLFRTAAIPDAPYYVSKYKFGVAKGVIEVYLVKLAPGGQNNIFVSLNKTIQCIQPVSALNPVDQLYNCSIVDPNFDRLLEHRDALKFTFKTEGGGFRTLVNTDNYGSFWRNQTFLPISKEQSVQFKFDFRDPTHCEETGSCTPGQTMLRVPDRTRNAMINITWNGWRDEDSGMFRYAWEVFKMTKATEGELEIHPDRALQPLRPPTEVLDANYTTQYFTLPSPGMYSIILEAGDQANNTKFVRRLCFFDPDPQITSDPLFPFYVTTASPAANYVYQNSTSVPVHVTWGKHFRNALHEDEGLLGSVRRYPVELRDTEQADDTKVYRKVIDPTSKQEDHEGERTVSLIRNLRGIISFDIAHDRDSNGGKNQSSLPLTTWVSLGLNTSFTVPYQPLYEAETVTVWVRATDYMGSQMVERTQVSFDSTPPSIISSLAFHVNVPVPGLEFSSTFELHASDQESGIAYVLWTFSKASNNQILFQARVPGANASNGCGPQNITICNCVKTGYCFKYNNSFSLTNCQMLNGLDQAGLASESIDITADVTNMAGLVTTLKMTKSDLTKLNGTQGYFPPQNITVVSQTQNSVTLSWTFPPSCFLRTALWVVVNGQKFPVHKDAREYTVGNLQAGKSYTIYMQTGYAGEIESLQQPFTIQTAPEEGLGAGGIVGIIIALLLVACLVTIIVVFVLWKKGKVFQREGTPVYRGLQGMSRAFTTVRKSIHRDAEDGAFSNAAYKSDTHGDEIYLYGEMAFETRPAWQLNASSLSLTNQVSEGRFAIIYRAAWRHDKKEETVAAKMLKANFNEEDALKMQAKINFMATQLEEHENVIKFLGAVTDNTQWGPVLVMEYCDVGQMDKWLMQKRGKMTEDLMDNLFRFSLQVANGMNYLASKRIVHRRLAARNILLTLSLEVKVAGFGPQPKGGEAENEEHSQERVPIKWTAPEALTSKAQTEKSDVWSYGIVLWEIFSMGEVPYPSVRSNEIGTRLKSGYRMDKPEYADDFFYDLMKECWQYKPGKRPTFGTIKAKLSKFYNPSNRQSGDFYYAPGATP